ncbi:hypothetical protein G8A07_12750 [Roseateles sp. DAIF2]|uniref:DegT/DnrJ/EryC1/StrS family aminotransferase n=1 Tax=Roseateles sp. DAIF2 TaxID=2714952 RepID=UPI0018A29A39|nr:DegT/DnrJ/EryC1/StrS family aminotransferase [Roseateles sp. DAIF2]QPF73704.1 hypothetical protein G8A07_12750 [Roseateles sp. DAIF2]
MGALMAGPLPLLQGFQRFDPSGCAFPPVAVPLLPVANARGWRLRARQEPGTPAASHLRRFGRGRYALHQAYRLAGLRAGGLLLAPAYHCRTMLDPAIALEARIALYPVDAQLHPDLTALAALLDQPQTGPRVLLLSHFFGFPVPEPTLQALLALCERHGVPLIEDCSHLCMPVLWQRQTCNTGRRGAFGTASSYKFFPVPDGGELWSNAAPLPQDLTLAPSPREELRGLKHLLDAALRGRGVRAPSATAAPSRDGLDAYAEGLRCSPFYDRAQERRGGLDLAGRLAAHADLDQLTAARRRHYAAWLRHCSGLPGCRPLYPELPDEVIPYMFPLLLDDPQRRFAALKHRGLPIWRWDDMGRSDCPVAGQVRLGLIHLPCHQSLSPRQLAWMQDTLAEGLRA